MFRSDLYFVQIYSKLEATQKNDIKFVFDVVPEADIISHDTSIHPATFNIMLTGHENASLLNLHFASNDNVEFRLTHI